VRYAVNKPTCTVKSCAITTVVKIKFFSIELVVLFFLPSDMFVFITRKVLFFKMEKCKIDKSGMWQHLKQTEDMIKKNKYECESCGFYRSTELNRNEVIFQTLSAYNFI